MAAYLTLGVLLNSLLYSVAASGSSCPTPNSQPWTQFIQSPSSRSVKPQSILRTTGNVQDVSSSLQLPSDVFKLTGPSATITYDFGKMVAGYPIFNFGEVTCLACINASLPAFTCGPACQGLGIAYSEWLDAVGPESDHQTDIGHDDGTVFVPVVSNETYEVPTTYARGSFRYLTISLSPTALATYSLEVSFAKVQFLAAPNIADDQLQQYTGYFYSSDDLLNRIWYAGAYTIQLCSIAANSSVNHLQAIQPSGWSNDATADGLSAADILLTDGAKRDRNPWSGDVGVSLRSALVTSNTDNLASIRNVLRECITLQDSVSKFFPYAGSPLGDIFVEYGALLGIAAYGSDTYNLWTIVNYADYTLTAADTDFGNQYYSQILDGLQATYQYVGADNLYNGTKTLDWGRIGQGGKNSALNSLYYYALLQTAKVARYLSSSNDAAASELEVRASSLKTAINALLWDQAAGLYYDNTTTAGKSLHPTDGNTFAINFNVTESPAQGRQIAQNLNLRLTPYGSTLPELPGGMSPYISSQQIRAQFSASPSDASRAMDLIRTQWSYMLQNFSSSTLLEGYASDGSRNYPFYAGDSSFVSAAHGWSTGPSYSLLASVVGIRASPFDLLDTEGDWAFQPHVNGSYLSSASGGFTTHLGLFNATWKTGCSFSATLNTPLNTSGTVYIPSLSPNSTIKLNGVVTAASLIDSYYVVSNVLGGALSIKASSGAS